MAASTHPTFPTSHPFTQPLLPVTHSPNLSNQSPTHPSPPTSPPPTQPLQPVSHSPTLSNQSSTYPTSPTSPPLTQPLIFTQHFHTCRALVSLLHIFLVRTKFYPCYLLHPCPIAGGHERINRSHRSQVTTVKMSPFLWWDAVR